MNAWCKHCNRDYVKFGAVSTKHILWVKAAAGNHGGSFVRLPVSSFDATVVIDKTYRYSGSLSTLFFSGLPCPAWREVQQERPEGLNGRSQGMACARQHRVLSVNLRST